MRLHTFAWAHATLSHMFMAAVLENLKGHIPREEKEGWSMCKGYDACAMLLLL
jgi:uncharacterized protein (DUF2236 family)